MSSSDGQNASINLKHGKKASEVFIETEKQGGAEEDDEQQELEIERWTDDSECMWLSSSETKSSSLSFDEDASSRDSIDSQHFFTVIRSYDPFPAKKIADFDGLQINPLQEASLVFDRSLKSSIVAWKDGYLKEEEIVSWLLNSSQDNLERSYSSCSEIAESFSNKSLNEVEDFDISKHAMKLDDELDTNGPLFWPFEQKFNWSSEPSWDFFIMSPIKNSKKFVNVEELFMPKSIMLRLDESRKHREKRLVCTPKAIIATEWNTTDVRKNLRRIHAMPSGLWNTETQYSSKEEVTKMKNEVQEINIIDPFTNRLISECDEFLEEDFWLSEELPIEKFVGLDEFDGHEGIHMDTVEDCFLLDD